MKRVILILPVADCAAFNTALYDHDPGRGEMFIGSSLLSVNGSLPATHAMASSLIEDNLFAWISEVAARDYGQGHCAAWNNIHNPSWPWVEWLPALGLKQVSGEE